MQNHSAPTRRDLAKQETRAALADAAVEILREAGMSGVTADAVAQRAGVSRRTFFNYFPSTEAVLAVPSMDFMTVALEEFGRRPADEPIGETVVAALTAADPELLARFAAVVRLCDGHADAERVERETWAQAEAELVEAMHRRFPDAEPLRVDVLSAAILATGRVAVLAWVAALPEHDSADAPAELRRQLIDAITYLTDGFPDAPVRH